MRGRRLSQISIVGHYAYETKPATLAPWGINSCTWRHTRAPAPSSTASRANGRREIAAEAMREPDACPHVAQPPAAPGAARLHPGRGREAGPRLGRQQPGRQGRKLRADGLALAAGVVSLPAEQRQDWPCFRRPPWHGFGSSTASACGRWWSTPTRSTRTCTSTPCRCRGSDSRFCTQGGRLPPKRPRKGPKRALRTPHTSRQWGWQDDFQRAVAAPFRAYAAWPWQAAIDSGA